MEVKLTPEKFDKIQQDYEQALRERARQIKIMRDELEWSFDRIGGHFGISKQAASQIYRGFKSDDDNS